MKRWLAIWIVSWPLWGATQLIPEGISTHADTLPAAMLREHRVALVEVFPVAEGTENTEPVTSIQVQRPHQTYEVDAGGRIIQFVGRTVYFDRDIKMSFVYNAQGRLAEQRLLIDFGQDDWLFEGENEFLFGFERDPDGRVRDMQWSVLQGEGVDDLPSHRWITYDEKGRMIQIFVQLGGEPKELVYTVRHEGRKAIQEEVPDPDDSSPVSWTEVVSNVQGQITQATDFFPSLKQYSRSRFAYTGSRLTEERQYTSTNGEKWELTTRKAYDYSDNGLLRRLSVQNPDTLQMFEFQYTFFEP